MFNKKYKDKKIKIDKKKEDDMIKEWRLNNH